MIDPEKTVTIPLHRKDGTVLTALISAVDWPLVRQYSWWAQWEADGYFVAITKIGENRGRDDRQVLRMHTLVTGLSPVSHRNGNRLDNRRSNLYAATPESINSSRRSSGGVSQYKGVTWVGDRHKWRARIKINGRWHQIGRFDDETEAAKAYDLAALQAWGLQAFTNFPLSTYLIDG
jgi:hypothetical protein